MRSLYDNTVVQGYAVAYNTTGFATCVGAVVDTRGYNTAALRVFTSNVAASIAVNAGASLVASLWESATSTGTFTPALDNTGAAIAITVVATTTAVLSDARIEGLGQNRKRYLQVITQGNFGAPVLNNKAFTSVACLELGRGFNVPPTTTTSNT